MAGDNTFSEKFTVQAWAGSLDDLSSLIGVCDDLNTEARKHLIQSHNERNGDDLDEATVAGLRQRIHTKDVYEKNRNRLLDELRHMDIELTVSMRGDREISGEPELVLTDVDARKTTDASILVGGSYSGPSGLTVSFTRGSGCRVTVRSNDKKWVSHARTEVQRTLLKNRPWYWWLRGSLPLTALFFVTALIGVTPVLLSEPSQAAIIAAFAVLVFVPNLLPIAVRRFIPAFELTESGQRNQGSVILGSGIAIAGWVGGIFIPNWLFT